MIKYLSKHLSKSNMDFYFYNESYPERYKNNYFICNNGGTFDLSVCLFSNSMTVNLTSIAIKSVTRMTTVTRS